MDTGDLVINVERFCFVIFFATIKSALGGMF